MRRVIGLALVAAPFAFIIGMMVHRGGLMQTLQTLGTAALIVGCIAGGVYLLQSK